MSEPSPQPPEATPAGRPPRGPWITEAEVWKACQKLAAQRIPLTTPRVREAIGNRGSNNTVLRYIDSWKAAHREQPEEVAVTPPSPAPDQLREPMQLVWDRARLEVREEVAAEREALAAKARELDERHEKDQEEIQTVRLLNDQLKSIVDALSNRLDATQKALTDHTTVMAKRMEIFTEAHVKVGETVTSALALSSKAQASGLTTLAFGIGDLANKAATDAERSEESRKATSKSVDGLGEALTGMRTGLDAVLCGFDSSIEQILKANAADLEERAKATNRAISDITKPLSEAVSALGNRMGTIDSYLKDVTSSRNLVEGRLHSIDQIQADHGTQQKALVDQMQSIEKLMQQILNAMPVPSGKSSQPSPGE